MMPLAVTIKRDPTPLLQEVPTLVDAIDSGNKRVPFFSFILLVLDLAIARSDYARWK